jgi:hypothetical protein
MEALKGMKERFHMVQSTNNRKLVAPKKKLLTILTLSHSKHASLSYMDLVGLSSLVRFARKCC